MLQLKNVPVNPQIMGWHPQLFNILFVTVLSLAHQTYHTGILLLSKR